jgi:RHS repeat-associated protein
MDAGYVYDAAGNVKSIADTPAGGQRDVQCFDYDYLRRMTRAWTTADTCDASPMTVGGPAPYHHSWTFDKAGNRATETIHGTVDTVRNYTYPDAGQGQNQPHTLRSISETGPGGDKSYGYSYDTSGSTTARPGQELTWDAEGRLATSKPTDGAETSYVYDANGNRIVRKEPGAITLFLGGMELRLDTATRAVTATRFYSFGGLPIGVRTPAGMFFQAGDHHGTNAATINAVSGSITWRRTLPYGGVRGAAPASWPDQKGFVGGTEDNTGLTHLGAREYDPLIGRFVSVDPIIDINDPQQMHGFAYAGSRPVTAIDASGLRAWDGDEEDDNGYPVFNPYCGDEWERSATADPGRAQRIREFRKKQILEGKYPDLLDTIKDFVEEIDRKTKAKQGRGGHMADAAEALWEAIFGEDPIDQMSIEICIDATLKRIDESRGNEGTKLGGGEQSGFGDKEFELAFILAWDGHEVVSKDKHYSPSGTVNTKAFDAWVDGVRSEFKTVGVDSPNTRQEVFRRANGKAAERLYIHAKNISPDSLEEGRKSFLRNSGSPDYTHYEVVGWDDTVGVDQWSRPLRSINTPVTCKKFLWWGCG